MRRALVITGEGGAFCAGGDPRALSEDRRPATANRERIRRLHVWFSELLNLEIPVESISTSFPANSAALP